MLLLPQPIGNGEMPDFKIAAAQVASVRGDIDANIATHAAAIAAAAKHEVCLLVFPELSLTGYEPDLAAELAMTAAENRLAPLFALARQHQMEIVVGAPLPNGNAKPALGAILITAAGTTRSYRKMHLGASERPYFEPGDTPLTLSTSGHTVGIAICADSFATCASPGVCRSRREHLRGGCLFECRVVRDRRAQAGELRSALPDADHHGEPRRVSGLVHVRGQERGVGSRWCSSGAG